MPVCDVLNEEVSSVERVKIKGKSTMYVAPSVRALMMLGHTREEILRMRDILAIKLSSIEF